MLPFSKFAFSFESTTTTSFELVLASTTKSTSVLLEVASIILPVASHHLEGSDPLLVVESAVAVDIKGVLHVLNVLHAWRRGSTLHAELLQHLGEHLHLHESVPVRIKVSENGLCVAFN